MLLAISAEEKDYLMTLLAQAYKETMQEENRTDTLTLKESLKQRILLIDNLQAKVAALTASDEEKFNIKSA